MIVMVRNLNVEVPALSAWYGVALELANDDQEPPGLI